MIVYSVALEQGLMRSAYYHQAPQVESFELLANASRGCDYCAISMTDMVRKLI